MIFMEKSMVSGWDFPQPFQWHQVTAPTSRPGLLDWTEKRGGFDQEQHGLAGMVSHSKHMGVSYSVVYSQMDIQYK